jgi:hypothetical protein
MVLIALCFMVTAVSFAQEPPIERVFPQPKSAVEKAVKALAPSASGRLPVLDGFAQPSAHLLDRYQKGFYQCSAQVTADPSGGARVKVTAKITAWYSDPASAQSGYQVLRSNGRLETDFLDRVQEALGGVASSTPPAAAVVGTDQGISKKANTNPAVSVKPLEPSPTLSAPAPGGSVLTDAITASRTPVKAPGDLPSAPSPAGKVDSIRTQKAVADRRSEELKKEARNLEEILRNQAEPNNLAAVKKSGTPVLASPNEGAKQLFLAQAEDEFEILDVNANWVHVRISGLSRGWIRRTSLELPEEAAPATQPPRATQTESQAPASAGTPPFQIENEQIASFPGQWEPLRGKTVKIITVQKTSTRGSSVPAKLDFAKWLFEREYPELSQGSSTAGVVIIFDSEDGGMMATTLPVLQHWKSGTLSDEALWRRSYFDPPEAFQLLASP